MKPHLFLIAAALLASGCGSKQLYSWGDYDGLLYRQYKDASKAEEMRTTLEEHVLDLEQERQKVPPGLYAELGTLHLQAGDREKAKTYYERELATWPESASLMKAMTGTLASRDARRPAMGSTK